MGKLSVLAVFSAILAMTMASEDSFAEFQIANHSTKDIRVDSASLKLGKWVRDIKEFSEVAAPNGLIAKADTEDNFVVASGRKMSLYGTEGSFQLTDVTSGRKVVKISFEAPWKGGMSASMEKGNAGINCVIHNGVYREVRITQQKEIYCTDA